MFRLKHPRIAPLPESEWSSEAQEVLAPLRHNGQDYNVFTTLAHHPKLLKKWLVFANYIFQSTLPARERELVILRMGWLCRAEYEWGHHAEMGKDAGLSHEEIRRVAAGPDAPGWDPFDTTLLRAADELHAQSILSDSTWKALAARYNTQQILDVIFTAGQYSLVCMALNSCGVQLEPGVEGFPSE